MDAADAIAMWGKQLSVHDVDKLERWHEDEGRQAVEHATLPAPSSEPSYGTQRTLGI